MENDDLKLLTNPCGCIEIVGVCGIGKVLQVEAEHQM